MKLGTIVKPKYFNGTVEPAKAQKYQELLVENFGEIGMFAFGQIAFIAKKCPSLETDYEWRNIDCFVDFAQERDLRVQYNTVVNNKDSFPDWYRSLSSGDRKEFLRRHIKTVVRRYKGKIYLYKLVNEAARDNEQNFLGTDESKTTLIAQMFQWAKEENPDGLFMINDFGNFFRDDIRQQYIDLINRIQQAGGRIGVVGLQGHMWPFELPTDEDINITLEQIHSSTDLPIHITEFDLSYDNSLHEGSKIDPKQPFTSREGVGYKSWFDYQAYAYRHFYEMCNKKDYVECLTFWGFCDEDVPWERPGTGLFDEKFNPKPAFNIMKDILQG